jgi:hypothetical protein
MDSSLDELREKAELLERIQSALQNLGGSSNKRPREEASSEIGDQPAKKRDLRLRPPPESELYYTKDYERYCAFISTQESTAEANGYTEEQRLAVAVMYLAPTIRKLWSSGLEKGIYTKTWESLQEFLLKLLGDPANRKWDAWSRFLRARPREDEEDFAYWHRWMQLRTEIGEDVNKNEQLLDPSRVETILSWPEPKNTHDVQSFIGFANFYRRFIKNFSKISVPLTDMLKKPTGTQLRAKRRLAKQNGSSTEFLSPQAKEAFYELREAFAKVVTLHHFDPERPCRLETDSSGFAICGILIQLNKDGQWVPVSENDLFRTQLWYSRSGTVSNRGIVS